MNKIQLLKEPGYIYDLNFIFCLHFNTKLYIDALPYDNKREENIKYLKGILAQYNDIPEDLYVFFHAIDSGRCFLPTYYFNPYADQFATAYNFKFLQNELLDYDRLIRNCARFYFHKLDNKAIEQCATDREFAFACIKASEYANETKAKLYEFFIDPQRYIHLLQYELIHKDLLLSEYYKNNYQIIIDLYNKTSIESLQHDLKHFRNLDINSDILHLSFCLHNNFCIYLHRESENFFLMLGCQYFSTLKFPAKHDAATNLNNLGTALADESRIKILQLLLKHEEITCKDLEKSFDFSGSTAYHHITIMARAGLVKTRNQGKTVLYSLNRKHFDAIITILSNYSSLKEGVKS